MKTLLILVLLASPASALRIEGGNITTAKLANGSVTTPKLHTEALDGFTGKIELTNPGVDSITIINPDATTSSVYFGSASDDIGAQINWIHNGNLMTIGTNNADDDIRINTGDGSEAMRILDSGNVGIGTASPEVALEVVGNIQIANNTCFNIEDSGGVNDCTFFKSASDVVTFSNGAESWLQAADGTDPDVYFNSGGNVGIGTASPGQKLHVLADAEHIEMDHTTTSSYGGFKISEAGAAQGTINVFGTAWSVAARRGDMEISTADGDITIQPNGNVGIGADTSPTATLQVTTNTAVNKFSSIELLDDATEALETHFGKNGILTIMGNDASYCIVAIRGGTNNAAILADPSSTCAVADTDVKIAIIADGDGTYSFKNRRGSAVIFSVHFVGFE